MKTTRRDFLKTTAVLAAGAAIIPPVFSINKGVKPKVVIIGAGFAGLSAAYRLKQKGCEVTVLESRGRVGGRVFSHPIDTDENLVIELGAEWVGASHERMITMCKEFGLELLAQEFVSHTLVDEDGVGIALCRDQRAGVVLLPAAPVLTQIA